MNENPAEQLTRQTTGQVSDNNTEMEPVYTEDKDHSPSIYQPSGSISQKPLEIKFPTPKNEKINDGNHIFNTEPASNQEEESKEVEVPHIASEIENISQVSSNEKSVAKIQNQNELKLGPKGQNPKANQRYETKNDETMMTMSDSDKVKEGFGSKVQIEEAKGLNQPVPQPSEISESELDFDIDLSLVSVKDP